jgi:putative sterol carrier protein
MDLAEWTADWLREHFRADAARGVAAVFELVLSGPDAGTVCVQVEEGRIKTSLGRDAAPDVRYTLSSDDWRDFLAGRANAEMLAMTGRVRIEGDHALALKLRALFRRTA